MNIFCIYFRKSRPVFSKNYQINSYIYKISLVADISIILFLKDSTYLNLHITARDPPVDYCTFCTGTGTGDIVSSSNIQTFWSQFIDQTSPLDECFELVS